MSRDCDYQLGLSAELPFCGQLYLLAWAHARYWPHGMEQVFSTLTNTLENCLKDNIEHVATMGYLDIINMPMHLDNLLLNYINTMEYKMIN